MNNVENKVKRKLTGKEKWIFIDYFDTLVSRKCNPEEVKMRFAIQISRLMDFELSPLQIYKIRIEAESALSSKYNGLIKQSYDYDSLCKNIYERLVFWNDVVAKKRWKNAEDFLKCAYDIEIEIECNMQFLNEEIYEVLKFAKKRGLKIAIVSDFYIGKKAYELFGHKHVLDILDEIFVSCDFGKRKDTGELYKYILARFNLKPQECIMIGDNRKSDYLIPKKMGINAIRVKRNLKLKLKEKKYLYRELASVEKKHRQETYVNYAFSLYFFIDNLYKSLRKENIRKVLFCAREGEFLKELFNYYTELNELPNIENEYFYVSRLSTYVPSLKDIEQEKFEILHRQSESLSIKSFLLSIGFAVEKISEICARLHFEPEKIISNFFESQEYEQLKEFPVFIVYYDEIRNEQKHNFKKYLDTFVNESEDITIIDVGWKGTIQDNIFNFLKKQRNIKGYYLGLSDNKLCDSMNRKVGINFSSYPYKSGGYDIWEYDKSFYEKILYASHASTVGYSEEGKPIMENFLNERDTYEYIRPFQIKVKELFKEIAGVMSGSCYQTQDVEDIFRLLHLKNLCFIGKKHINMQNFMVKNHFQNFGEFSWSQTQLITLISQIFMSNKKEIIYKIWKDGLSINYMYPGNKVLQKLRMVFLIPLYGRMVFLHEKRKYEL